MPVISRFFGIAIYMYWRDHAPPHFHALYQDGEVTVEMTLTSPACPVGPMLQGQIYHVLSQVDGVEDVEVNLVWEPPWNPKEMATDEVKITMGIW